MRAMVAMMTMVMFMAVLVVLAITAAAAAAAVTFAVAAFWLGFHQKIPTLTSQLQNE
jgi:hypothetical protein